MGFRKLKKKKKVEAHTLPLLLIDCLTDFPYFNVNL